MIFGFKEGVKLKYNTYEIFKDTDDRPDNDDWSEYFCSEKSRKVCKTGD